MNRNISMLKNFITDKEKKSYKQISIEVFDLWRKNKSFPKYYFGRLAYKKHSPDYRNFNAFAFVDKLTETENGIHTKETI